MRRVIHRRRLKDGFLARFGEMLLGKWRLGIAPRARLHGPLVLLFPFGMGFVLAVDLLLDVPLGGGRSLSGAGKAVAFGLGLGRHSAILSLERAPSVTVGRWPGSIFAGDVRAGKENWRKLK
jgi:hypothetical protein